MPSWVSKVKAVGKPIVAALGFILAAVNDHIDLVPVEYRGYVTGLIAVLTLVGIYHAPYAPLTRKSRSARKLGGKKRHPVVTTHPVGPAMLQKSEDHDKP